MYLKYFSLLFVLIILSSDIGISQTDNIRVTNNSVRLSRFRLSAGYVSLLSVDEDFEFRHLFFNLSFRSSGFDKSSSPFKIKLAFEPGINGLIISEKDYNEEQQFSIYFIPYAKFGPEMRLTKNLFLGGSLGFGLASFESAFALFPFFGLNGFYLFDLNDNLSIEFETGFHSTFSSNNVPYLIYFTIGLSLI